VITALAVVVAALVTGSALAGSAGSSKVIAFTATYKGKATVKVTDQLADISATGAGKGTVIGVSKVTGLGKGDASAQPCVPFTGTGAMSGAGGTKLLFKMAPGSQGCGDEAGEIFSVVGRATVTKGLGKLKKARGSLKLTGTYDHTSGAFSIKFSGKLTQ
jgi:hypothetical protein